MSGIDGILPDVQSRIPCDVLLLPWNRAVRRLLLQLSDIRLSGRQLAIGIKLTLGRSECAQSIKIEGVDTLSSHVRGQREKRERNLTPPIIKHDPIKKPGPKLDPAS